MSVPDDDERHESSTDSDDLDPLRNGEGHPVGEEGARKNREEDPPA
jgi:hypothetical protein